MNMIPKRLNKEPLIEAIWQAQFEPKEGLPVGDLLPNSSTVTTHMTNRPSIEQLGWSAIEALETHLRLRNFADDWDAPGMEAYDDL